MTTWTAIDVPAGAGGASLGLKRAGFDVLGVERDPHAVATHRAHVGPCEQADMTTWLPPYPVHVVGGGVPCQSWSSAGKRGGFDDPRGTLYIHLLRIAIAAQAECVWLENVRGITTKRDARTGWLASAVLRAAWQNAGFTPVNAVLCSADYGVPQNRYRYFLLGFRDPRATEAFRWPVPTHGPPGNVLGLPPWITVREALGLGDAPYWKDVRSGPGSLSMSVVDVDVPARTVRCARTPDKLGPLDSPSPTVTGTEHKSANRFGSRGAKTGAPRAGDRLNPALAALDAPSATVSTGGINTGGAEPFANARDSARLSAELAAAGVLDRPGTTVSHHADLSKAGHHESNKTGAVRLTIEQLAALQGFPPGFTFTGNKSQQHLQCGNALPPAMAEALGGAIIRALMAIRENR